MLQAEEIPIVILAYLSENLGSDDKGKHMVFGIHWFELHSESECFCDNSRVYIFDVWYEKKRGIVYIDTCMIGGT